MKTGRGAGIRGRSRCQAGMVTAEAAVSLLAMVIVLLGALWVITLLTFQARCLDAARDTARAAARGESVAVSRAEGLRSAPPGARIGVATANGLVTAVVSVDAKPPWPGLSRMPGIPLEGRAVVAPEPGVVGGESS